MPALAENLKRIRKAKEMSQPALAKLSGVSQQLISQIENGKNTTTKELPELARALGVAVSELDENFSEAPEKIPPAVLKAFEAIPGAPLTEREVRLIVDQLDLIARSRRPHNDDSQNSGQQQAG